MSDEHALTRDAVRGAQAQALLESDLLKEAFAALERTYVEAWRETRVMDTDARERLWQALQILGKVQGHLKSVVTDGDLAQAELKEIADLATRQKYGAYAR